MLTSGNTKRCHVLGKRKTNELTGIVEDCYEISLIFDTIIDCFLLKKKSGTINNPSQGSIMNKAIICNKTTFCYSGIILHPVCGLNYGSHCRAEIERIIIIMIIGESNLGVTVLSVSCVNLLCCALDRIIPI